MRSYSSSVHFSSLGRVRDTLGVDWYRCHLPTDRLRALTKRSDWRGFLQAGGHVTLFLGTGSLVCLAWARELWILFVVALFVHGSVASFFAGIAPHELGHRTVFRTKFLNDLFLYPISLIAWFDPISYRVSHTYHHRYTLYPEGDGEVLLPLHPSVGRSFLLQMFTINLFTERGRTFGKGGIIRAVIATVKLAAGRIDQPELPSHRWLAALYEDQPREHRKAIQFARLTLAFHTVVIGTALATGWWVVIPVLVTPSFTANWLSYFVGMTQHCGLRDQVPDFRKCVRSVRLDPVSEFLYWHMNWHTEHHMYASVPCYHLKQLSREIAKDMPKPKNLIGAWREMLETWHRQQSDPSYQFDTPVPLPGGQTPVAKPSELASSIGDLAPKGLR